LRPVTQLGGQLEGILLERHGDVQALAVVLLECHDGRGQLSEFHPLGSVADGLAGLPGELGMYRGGLAVLYRVPHYRVTINHKYSRSSGFLKSVEVKIARGFLVRSPQAN